MSGFAQTAAPVPRLETARLILRGYRPGDLAASAAMWADPLVTRYIGGTPLSREAVWGKLLRYAGHWLWLGYGYWAIEEKESGALIGEVGFMDAKRDMKPSLDGAPEVGYSLVSRAHGNGYATEAVRAAAAWGDEHLESKRTGCIIIPDNTVSVRVAEKCGYTEIARTTYKDQPIVVFERFAPPR